MFENERAWFRSLNKEHKAKVIDLYEEIMCAEGDFSCFWDFIRKRNSDIKELLAPFEENAYKKQINWFRSLSSKDQEKLMDLYDKALFAGDPYSCFWDFIKKRAMKTMPK